MRRPCAFWMSSGSSFLPVQCKSNATVPRSRGGACRVADRDTCRYLGPLGPTSRWILRRSSALARSVPAKTRSRNPISPWPSCAISSHGRTLQCRKPSPNPPPPGESRASQEMTVSYRPGEWSGPSPRFTGLPDGVGGAPPACGLLFGPPSERWIQVVTDRAMNGRVRRVEACG
jgi:hypothetical protein